jgi:elongation of very long chain fatty acids protein 4
MERGSLVFMNLVGSLRDPGVMKVVDRLENSTREFVRDIAPGLLAQYDHALTKGSSLSRNFPLMNPFHVALILLSYLAVIFVGTALMKRVSKPLNVKPFQIFHNGFLVLLSLYMTVEGYYETRFVNGYSWWGNPLQENERGAAIARVMWLFFWSKIPEFNDTVIMILRKSFRQVSFLHVYHHFTIFAIWWSVIFYGPGGDAVYSVILNSFVHVIMYSYYLSCTLGCPLTFIKPYITIIQMTQFVLMMVQSLMDLKDNYQGYPRFLVWTLLLYMITLFILFMNFFLKDRKRARQERLARKLQAGKIE